MAFIVILSFLSSSKELTMFDRKIKNILIRGTNWIGDAVLTMPAVNAVRKRFPEAKIFLLVKPWVAPVFENNPHIDKLLIYKNEYKKLSGKVTLIRELKKYRFDLAILFQNAFEAAFLAFLAGIPVRYGYSTDGRALLLTDKIKPSKETLKKHQIWYYLDLLKPLGINMENPQLSLMVSAEEKALALKILKENKIKKSDIIIGINPGASYGPAKRWLPDRYAMLADRLVKRFNAKVIVFGGKEDKSVAGEVVSLSQHKLINLAGATSLREASALIGLCRFFISNDSGLMHIAAALNVPVIAIFGSTSPERTGPYGNIHHIMYKKTECSPCLKRICPTDFRCMESINVDDVYSQVEEMISINHPISPLIKGRARNNRTPAVFLDRDGTICQETPSYLRDIKQLRLIPKAAEAIRLINKSNMKAVIITNQSAVARGFITEERLKKINQTLSERLSKKNAFIDALYYCPHHPDVGDNFYKMNCGCRKPKPGLIKRAARELPINMDNSYMIGDKIIDIQLANKAGIKGILVLTGYGKKDYDIIKKNRLDQPAYVARDLYDAIKWILKDKEKRC